MATLRDLLAAVFSFTILQPLVWGGNETPSAEHRLVAHLMAGYPAHGPVVRPRANHLRPVDLNVSFNLVQIADVDGTKQSVTIHAYTALTWQDDFLTWDPAEYGVIHRVVLSSSAVWIPDLSIFNAISESCTKTSHVMFTWEGRAVYVPSCLYETACNVDISNFPFDHHLCSFTLGSWSYNDLKLNMTDIMFTTTFHAPSGQWNLSNHWVTPSLWEFRGARYTVATVSIAIYRRASFFAFLLILPGALLIVMTCVVFLLPPKNEAKINVGLSIFLSFTVLLNILMEATPSTSSNIPLLGYYFTLCSALIALSVFSATAILNICACADTGEDFDLPCCLKKVVYVIEKLVRFPAASPERDVSMLMGSDTDKSLRAEDGDPRSRPLHASQPRYDARRQWLHLASVLDRFFLCIFLFINVIASVIIFVNYTKIHHAKDERGSQFAESLANF